MKTTMEIYRLLNYLDDTDIPFNVVRFKLPGVEDEVEQVVYPSKDNIIYDFLCHEYSYGHENGLLEMMDHTSEEVYGNLTAQDAFNIIKEHYDSLQNK